MKMFRQMVEKRTYEMKCEKGYFILEVDDIDEIVCNSHTGETSKLHYSLHYRTDKRSGITTFLIGGWIPVSKTEKEFIEEELDFILYTDYFDDMIENHKKDMDLLEEEFEKEFFGKEVEVEEKTDTKKSLYDDLHITFHGNTLEDGFGLSCEFTLHSPIKPMIKATDLMHYADSDFKVSEGFVEFDYARIEQDEDTEEIVIWIFEPSMDCGGEFLHQVKMLNYNPTELQEEIIKRWKEYSEKR